MKKYCYIPIEIKCREYPSKGVLALKAARRGFDVFLGDSTMVQPLALYGPSGVYLGTSVMEGHRRTYELLKQAGHRLVSLDEEGLIYYNKDNFIRGKVNEDVINMLDAFCLWGDHHRELVEEKAHFNNLYTLGNPRLEILKRTYWQFYQKEVEQYHERYHNYILLNSNFSSVNHYLGADHCMSIIKTLITFTQEDEIYQKAKMQHAKEVMEHFMLFADTFADRHPEINVIVRPHPSENMTTWKKLRKRNIHVLQEGSVIPWLIAATCLVQQNCTTAIEGIVLGTPTISYVPAYDERFDDSMVHQITKSCFDLNELTQVIDSLTAPHHKEESTKTLVENSTEKLRYYVHGLEAQSNVIDDLIKIMESISIDANGIFGRQHRLKMLQHIDKARRKDYDGYYAQKFDTLALSELKSLVKMLESVDGVKYSDVKIEEIFEGKLYRLSL